MSLTEDLQLGEVAVILVAVIAIGYYAKKAIVAVGGGILSGAQAVAGAAGAVATNVGAIASTAADQVVNPSIILPDDTPIGMAGTTVGDLRKQGFSENAIADLIAQTYGSF